MKQYHDLLQRILDEGTDVSDERTGVGTLSLFGEQIKFDLRKGFPAVTTKKLAFKSVTAELLWFLRGSDNVHDLRAITYGEEHRFNSSKRTIWDANYENQGKDLGYTDGFCGLIYGNQWRHYGLSGTVDKTIPEYNFNELPRVDQLAEMIKEAQVNPGSRRLLVEASNPMLNWDFNEIYKYFGVQYEVLKPVLPPCHTGFQIRIFGDYLDLIWKQRSVDCFLGLPFNIASYAELAHILARILGKTPRYLTGQLGDVHIYKNHMDQVKEQLSRTEFDLPELEINPWLKTLEDFEKATVTDFLLRNYKHHDTIKAPMAV